MHCRGCGSRVSAIVVAFWLLLPQSASAQAPAPTFVAPPRSIADITAILDQEKPDPAKRAKREADANAEPPACSVRVTAPPNALVK